VPGHHVGPFAVLQLVPDLEPGEVARNTVDIARHLRARGWRSLVASAGGSLERELAAVGATHLRLPLATGAPLARWRNAGRLARAIRQHGIDLLHARAAGPAASGVQAALRTGASLVTTMHELPVGGDWPDGRLRGERVIAVSDFIAELLATSQRVEPARLRTVRRWIDPREFDPERVRGHRVLGLAERWGLAAAAKVVLVPCLAAGDRGHLLLLQALARLPRTDCLALLMGDLESRSAYGKELLALIRRAGLGERVRFGGATDDLPAAFSLADVVVLPATRPDPSGVLAAAAQAMGKPVIATSQGALAESVMPAATGWLVPPDDPDELAAALGLALAMEESVRRRLAARARAFVVSEFGMDRMCERTLDIYRELVEPSVAPHASSIARSA
jgi:glycosyltransferase involved in cell wall biosynthesis